MHALSHDLHRTQAMLNAIELGVDAADFRFQSLAERAQFVELEAEFLARIEGGDHSWDQVG